MKKIKNILALICSLSALVLEILPYGAVLKFAVDEGKSTKREFFSYFDMTVYGYGNVFPLLTGILTVLLAVLLVVSLLKKAVTPGKTFLISLSATAISLFPAIIYGLDYLSPVGVFVTLCLLAFTAFLFQKEALK